MTPGKIGWIGNKTLKPKTPRTKMARVNYVEIFVYDNSPRNLNSNAATDNLLTTKVTCEFLVNTVLPLMCC